MRLTRLFGGGRPRLAALALCCAALLATASPARAQHDRHAHHGGHEPAAPEPRYARTFAAYAPPDVTLTDAGGARVSLASVLKGDGPVMLQFIFTTCPAVCPVMSATFAAVQNRLGPGAEKVRLVSISIDPEHDTPERLREYARKFKAGPRWLFLTGELGDIVSLRKAFDAYPGDNKMRHQPLTFMRLSPGRPWLRLDGLTSAAQLIGEYERLGERR
jgi:protein SCO1/2